jgi:phosphoribosyl 1,2-cyclic phosphodiesterase
MFLDANTWHPAEHTGHESVLGNLRLIDRWQPKRAYMIHYSGYEDRDHPHDPVNGPMEMKRFRQELHRVAGGRDVRPAQHGMILGNPEPWPE